MKLLGHIITILGIFGTDYVIKEYVEQNRTMDSEEKMFGDTLIIRKHHNRGAFLNTGEKKPGWIRVLSIVLTLAATLLFVISFTKIGKESLNWGLTLLLGGAYSNTYDRLKRKYVVDYVSFNVPIKGIRKIIFNIGDFAIIIGAFMTAFSVSS